MGRECDLSVGRLLERLIDLTAEPMQPNLVFAARDHMATRVRALIEFLREGHR